MSDEELRRALLGMQPGGLPEAPLRGPVRLPGAPAMPSASAPSPAVQPMRQPAPVPQPSPYAQPAPAPMRAHSMVTPDVADFVARGGLPPRKPKPAPAADASGGDDPDLIPRVLSGIFSGLAGEEYDAAFWQGRDDRRAAQAEEAKKAAALEQQKLLEAEESDPRSQKSVSAQTSMAPLLRQLGLTDAEISTLSAADMRQLTKGGDLVTGLADARARARAEESKRALHAEALKEKRAYDEAQESKRDTRDFEQQKTVAAIGAGMTASRGIDQALLTDELARKRSAEQFALHEAARREAEERARVTRGDEKLQENTEQYSKAIAATGIPQARSQTSRLRELIAAAKERNGGKDIFTGVDNVIRRDPTGKTWGMASPEAQAILQELQTLRNVQIRNISGAAVSNSEMGRVAAAQGANALDSEEATERFLKSMENAAETDERNLLGGYGPKVKARYDENVRATSGAVDLVRVRKPNGEIKRVPRKNLEAFTKKYPGSQEVTR